MCLHPGVRSAPHHSHAPPRHLSAHGHPYIGPTTALPRRTRTFPRPRDPLRYGPATRCDGLKCHRRSRRHFGGCDGLLAPRGPMSCDDNFSQRRQVSRGLAAASVLPQDSQRPSPLLVAWNPCPLAHWPPKACAKKVACVVAGRPVMAYACVRGGTGHSKIPRGGGRPMVEGVGGQWRM